MTVMGEYVLVWNPPAIYGPFKDNGAASAFKDLWNEQPGHSGSVVLYLDDDDFIFREDGSRAYPLKLLAAPSNLTR